MLVSEDRVSHLAHKIYDKLYDDDLADFPDERRALEAIKESVGGFFSILEQVDHAVRDKLSSYSKSKVPGSREWEILYQKFYAEELAKRKW